MDERPSALARFGRRALLGVVLIGVGIGGYAAYASLNKPTTFTYRTVAVERGRVVARVTATGTLSALVTVQVGAQVSGRVQQLFADWNTQVKKGEVVAKLDPQLFEAAVAQTRANLYAAEGRLKRARAESEQAARVYERAKTMHAGGLVSKADLDVAETAKVVAEASIEEAKGSVEQARAALHQAQVNLGYTTILSPIDGVVISRAIDVGQTVAASLQAPVLFTIAEDLTKMQVDTNIAEGDVGKIRAAMEATFVVDAYPSRRFRGTIRQVRNAPQTVQNVVTYDAVIDVNNADLALKPGMTANVTMIYANKEDVLKIPNAALRFKPPPALAGSGSASAGAAPSSPPAAPPPAVTGTGTGRRRREGGGEGGPPPMGGEGRRGRESAEKTVWVLRGKVPVRVDVKVGLSDGTVTEVTEGDLREGDELIIEATSSDDPAAPAPTSRPNTGGRMRI